MNASDPKHAVGGVMISILILLTLSAVSGFVAGKYFFWPALVVLGAVPALLSAVVLQNQGFDALPGISIIVACRAKVPCHMAHR